MFWTQNWIFGFHRRRSLWRWAHICEVISWASSHATHMCVCWAHGDAREGKGNWRVEWVANTLTLPRNMVYPALLPLMRTPRLSVVDWTDAPADLNGLVRFAERRNLVSALVPSRFKRSLQFVGGINYVYQRHGMNFLFSAKRNTRPWGLQDPSPNSVFWIRKLRLFVYDRLAV